MLWTSMFMMLCFINLLWNFMYNKLILFEIEIQFSNFLSFSMNTMLDYFSITFSMFVLLISSMVILYGQYYMSNSFYQTQFNLMMFFFVLSMIFLIFSPSFMMLVIGWDGLGVTSFLLIIFYSNSSSNNAGILTFLVNRLGDMFFIFSISLLWMYSSWNFDQIQWLDMFLGLLILTTGMTKSAQIPFSSWLPNAMAAPTPVSALVHSSTLVTAGIFVFMRFFLIIQPLLLYLFMMSLSTLMLAGVMANFEWDTKKMIAFSTLSQLGLMMCSLSLNLIYYCFFHLITHALFKSVLFMLAGINIHNSNNNQDMRNSINIMSSSTLMVFFFLICIMALMSFPFLSGFFSKDLILDSSFLNMYLFSTYLMSIFLTVLYSVRYCYINLVNFNNSHQTLSMYYSNIFYLFFPSWILCASSLFAGMLLFNSVISIMNLVLISMMWKVNYFFMFFMFNMLIFTLTWKSSSLKKKFFFSNMWYLYYLTNQMIIKTPLKKMKMIILSIDQSSAEKLGPQLASKIQTMLFIFKLKNTNFVNIVLFMTTIFLFF